MNPCGLMSERRGNTGKVEFFGRKRREIFKGA
jgi:hypothetical protein